MKNNPLTRAQQAVLAVLRDQPDLVGVEAIARHLGKHPNTLRDHLSALIAAGLVERHQAPSDGRGRPRWLYGTAEPVEVDDNAELAAALAWRVAHRSRNPVSASRDVSRRWAGQIVARRGIARQRSARDGRAQVVDVLDEMGYAPRPDERMDKVALTRCPLLQVAHDVPEVVCNVHLGLVQELLAASGADPGRATLTPFAAPGACALRLFAPAAEAARTTGIRTAAGPRR